MALSDAMPPFSSTSDLIARARAAFQSGRHAEAERLAAEARLQDRASLDAIEILALTHRGRGDAAGAEHLLREAIAIDSQPRWPHDDLAMMLFDSGRVVEAEAACRAAIATDPANPQPEMMLGNILSEREDWSPAPPICAAQSRGCLTRGRRSLAGRVARTGAAVR